MQNQKVLREIAAQNLSFPPWEGMTLQQFMADFSLHARLVALNTCLQNEWHINNDIIEVKYVCKYNVAHPMVSVYTPSTFVMRLTEKELMAS